jgi:lipopolysaccharide transport system permease protein
MLVTSSARRPSRGAELWRFRYLLRSLVVRNLKVKYQRSVLGFLWTLLNPALTIAVLIAVFSYVIRMGMVHYWAFLLSGFFAWNFIAQMLYAGITILSEHATLRRSVPFPTELLIFGAGASRLFEFFVELAIALVLLVVFHFKAVPASFLLLPLLVVLQLLIATGFSMIVATLAVFYRDAEHALPVVFLVLFYLSPVFYPTSLVPESVRAIYLANPIAGLLTLYHAVLYRGEMPPAGLVAWVAVAAVALYTIGYAVFNRGKAASVEIA